MSAVMLIQTRWALHIRCNVGPDQVGLSYQLLMLLHDRTMLRWAWSSHVLQMRWNLLMQGKGFTAAGAAWGTPRAVRCWPETIAVGLFLCAYTAMTLSYSAADYSTSRCRRSWHPAGCSPAASCMLALSQGLPLALQAQMSHLTHACCG